MLILRLADNFGNGSSNIDRLELIYVALPEISILSDIIYCRGITLVIDTSNKFRKYAALSRLSNENHCPASVANSRLLVIGS